MLGHNLNTLRIARLMVIPLVFACALYALAEPLGKLVGLFLYAV